MPSDSAPAAESPGEGLCEASREVARHCHGRLQRDRAFGFVSRDEFDHARFGACRPMKPAPRPERFVMSPCSSKCWAYPQPNARAVGCRDVVHVDRPAFVVHRSPRNHRWSPHAFPKPAGGPVPTSTDLPTVQPYGEAPGATWLSLAVIRPMQRTLAAKRGLGRTTVDDHNRF